MITYRDKPVGQLLGVHSFEDLHRRLSVLEGLAVGEQAVRSGRVLSQAQAKRRLTRWLS